MIYRFALRVLLPAFVLFPLMISCGQKKEETHSSVPVPARFVGEEKQLVAKLFDLWDHKGHVASVDQAADILGIKVSDSIRADLLAKFSDSLMMHERLARYRAHTFVLTNEEKLIGEYIIVNEKRAQEFPTLEQVATALNIPAERIKDRLQFLSKLGMFYDLGAPDEYNKLGFSFGQSVNDFTFDLGLRQHVFRVDGGKPVNVGCAKEALFIVATEYPKNHVEYRTYDPVSLQPIDVVFDKGEVVSVQPESARLLEGGTCGTNNLFVTEANAQAFSQTIPRFDPNRQFPIFEVKQRFDETKKQAEESGK